MPISAHSGPETRAQALSDETLTRVDNDLSEVSKLPLGDKYALAERLMFREDDSPDAPSPDAPVTEPPAEEPASPAPEEEKAPDVDTLEASKAAEDKPFRKDRRYWKEKAIQEAAERNQLKQRLEDTERRLKALSKTEEESKAAKADKPLDPYDDGQMRVLGDELAQMKKELSGYRELMKSSAQSDFERTQAELKAKEEGSVFTEIARLQSEFDDLKTEKPFDRCNAEYAAWLDKLVDVSGFRERNPKADLGELRNMARELYGEDEDFRREAVAKKAKPPKELEKIETILTIHEKKARDGGGYRANYLDHLAESGALPDIIARKERDAMLKGANDTVDAMARGRDGATTLNPTDGSNAFPEKQGPEKMQAYLKDLSAKVQRGHRMTVDEKATAMTYMELLSAVT